MLAVCLSSFVLCCCNADIITKSSSEEEKGVLTIQLTLHLEVKSGTRAEQEPGGRISRVQRGAAYWLDASDRLSLLSYPTQDRLPRGGPTHSVSPPTSVKKMAHRLPAGQSLHWKGRPPPCSKTFLLAFPLSYSQTQEKEDGVSSSQCRQQHTPESPMSPLRSQASHWSLDCVDTPPFISVLLLLPGKPKNESTNQTAGMMRQNTFVSCFSQAF
nr:uncharacterized protein LOC121832714 isoform X2 [Peromyscus maniculatus bairdii]